MTYRGRFAPSPTGPLHQGSLVAALGSWLDARAHGGRWLVRIEDLDPQREEPGVAEGQVHALRLLGLVPDEPATRQSGRGALYQSALVALERSGLVYRCSCSRQTVEQAARAAALAPHVYAGTCRTRPPQAGPCALRFRVPAGILGVEDRACGRFTQDLARQVGDFVVRRADGLWSYQLAVVVDDGDQGITDIVRGADLLDNTPRQQALQGALGLAPPRYLHLPLVLGADGAKLSKQTGARALDLDRPLAELGAAWAHLGFDSIAATTPQQFLERATGRWADRWLAGGRPPDTIGRP